MLTRAWRLHIGRESERGARAGARAVRLACLQLHSHSLNSYHAQPELESGRRKLYALAPRELAIRSRKVLEPQASGLTRNVSSFASAPSTPTSRRAQPASEENLTATRARASKFSSLRTPVLSGPGPAGSPRVGAPLGAAATQQQQHKFCWTPRRRKRGRKRKHANACASTQVYLGRAAGAALR